ncbi:MAG: class I SAM-dependent methyltransferase [Thermogutta sp.]|uniref:class I SAM-dependent methyltransferase n=1 Tax=Thermogutta sp. TaxID=1962930 RepID=UPI0019BFD8D1|nr:class I SAM-dependent methyltransferase [Thermogutta sp.]MBC7354221.1 class I SAM-dependent methyltransferase [Thermogutta sp.]
MGLWSDLKVLYHMVFRPGRGRDHAERMESFYGPQAEAYDSFRRRLLQGREDLWAKLGVPEGGIWVDLGAGTGSNAEYFGENIQRLRKVILVDLSKSLLEVAQKRIQRHGWTNVETRLADATTFTPDEPVDVVTFSYSLTMIPDWFAAVDNAWRILKPGGRIGVVDFYVSRKHPGPGMRRHGTCARLFWTFWFNYDDVFPSPDHIPYLRYRFREIFLEERRAKVPYLPLARAPYYIFVGEKNTDLTPDLPV